MKVKLSLLALILCFASVFALAQTPTEKSSPTGLVLEVKFLKDKPPAYIAIGETMQTMRWAWYAAFERVPNFQTSAEKPPVLAVKFIPQLENGVIKVKVRVFTGQKTFEKEEAVTIVSMREGESVSVKELTNFGVVPFEIAVVRVAPSVSVLPSIENKTASLQVTSIEPSFSTLPTYKLTVQNVSQKAVSAFTFETLVEGRERLSGMPQNRHGENLIESGASYVKGMPSPLEYVQPTEGQVPKQVGKATIVISSVIFADGSFEGDAYRAAQFRAAVLGRKSQIKQIIALLQANENNTSEFGFEKFAAQSAKLETKVDEREIASLLKQFPSLDEKQKNFLRSGVEVGSSIVKKEFSDGTERFRQELETNTRAYLGKLKEQYQKWLALLP